MIRLHPYGVALELLRVADTAGTAPELARGVRSIVAGQPRADRDAATAALAHVAACLARQLPVGEREELLEEFRQLADADPAAKAALAELAAAGSESEAILAARERLTDGS
ncbi:hypothetical protein DQ244_06075 [Blastococcus sp. TBT05-19]|uniref:hypothetical protein n=1 Tax=Blastococcus sp. TBT05-19 TaxID=2250581 RepID=UPI000DE84007|nr:hypothetical protein [Blastococcus sp. TBT05-19]RBY94825.1 hypothetical protein DQ244_06075 [Blastococcus sp. TBT05-19]